MSEKQPQEKSEPSVPIGKVSMPILATIFAIITVCSWTWIAANQFGDLREQVQAVKNDIQLQLQGLTSRFDLQELKLSDRWSTMDMQRWALDLSKANPQLSVPSVGK